MTSIRDYEEQQFLDKLRESFPDETMRERIEHLYERDQTAIERQEVELRKAYTNISSALEATSKLTGLEVDALLTVVGRTSAFLNLPWYEVLSIIRSYHVQLNRIREEQEKASQ